MPFPGNWIFPKKSGKSSAPSIWEHPLPGPDSVLAFRTGFFPSGLSPKNETGIPKFKLHKKFKTFLGIQYWTGNFQLGTEICYISCLCLLALPLTTGQTG